MWPGTVWDLWELYLGCPLIFILAVLALSITLVRAFRSKGPDMEFEEMPQDEGERIFRENETWK